MSEIRIAVIGGTGVYSQAQLDNAREVVVQTRFGSVKMVKGVIAERTVYFMTRHGSGHSEPPHLVNYRANIAALKKLEVRAVIATAAVGTMRKEMPPGSMVVIDQFIDFTKHRPVTFFEGENGLVVHTDFTEPYCPEIRAALIGAAEDGNPAPLDGGCYVCTEGPRFETPAEIRMFIQWGGDLVGMTNVPEVVLAREAGLCYAAIALPTNYAAGISKSPLTHEEVLLEMQRNMAHLDRLLLGAIAKIPPLPSCSCKDAGSYWPDDW